MKRILFYVMAISLMISYGSISAQTYRADPANTVILWQGKKVMGEHQGTIQLKSGQIEINYNRPVSGKIVIDMTTIKDTDIKDDEMRQKLENHLRSDDFFGVDKYPEASLEIKSSERKNGGPISILGELTIKGISHPIEFVTNMSSTDDVLIFTGHIDIDRTLYDVRYGSGKFFENIGDRAIDDIFKLDYELYFTRLE